jgi:RimJ/RimL family protein N-acetyltransferase
MTSADPRIIRTARLTLRPHRRADLDAAAAMWTEPDVIRFTGGKPRARADVNLRLLAYQGLWAWYGHGAWAVEETATGTYLGEVGLYRFERGLPALADAPEAGWSFATAAHGKGYGREAVGAMLGWADANLTADRTVCMIEQGHVRSVAIVEALGFARTGETLFHGAVVETFARQRAG